MVKSTLIDTDKTGVQGVIFGYPVGMVPLACKTDFLAEDGVAAAAVR